MPNLSSLIELKNTIPEMAWPRVIAALRQDPLVWQALQSPDFRNLAISHFGSRPEKWTPAHIAWLTISRDLKLDDLRTHSLREIDPDMYQHAIRTYDLHVGASPPQMTLPAAGYLMLALLERHRQAWNWQEAPASAHWKTPYACLFGCLEQPAPMLSNLPFPLAAHALLANPLSEDDLVRHFHTLLVSVPRPERLTFLENLITQRPALARRLAASGQQPVGSRPSVDAGDAGLPPAFRSHILHHFKNIHTLIAKLNAALAQAEVRVSGGLDAQAAMALQESWHAVTRLQSDVLAPFSQISAALGEGEMNLAELTSLEPESAAALAITLADHNQLESARSLFASLEKSENSLTALAQATLALHTGKREEARNAALEAVARADQLSPYHTRLLAAKLLELKQPAEAINLLEPLCRTLPNDVDLAHLMAQAYAATGAYPQAVQAIHLAVALAPHNLKLWRDFARIHAYYGQWPAALEAWEAVVDRQSEPQITDLQHLAACALELKQIQKAEEVARTILKRSPEDGMAHALLGEVFFQSGKESEAYDHIQNALQIIPDQARPWLILARFQRQREPAAASQTLRKAALAAADKAEIQLALGEAYLQDGAISQALTSLRRADQLAEAYPLVDAFYLHSQIALPLTKAQFKLGHAAEALQTIEALPLLPGRQAAQLHLRAQVLLFLERTQEAIPLLAKALLADPENFEIGLDYARAELKAECDPCQAIYTLRALLERDPQNPEALALLAEALRMKNEPEEAFDAYQRALAVLPDADPYWYAQLSIGLAKTALKLDQPEVALAALQNIWEAEPQNLEVLQTLAEAYLASGLKDQARQIAQLARDAAPRLLENLRWFSALMLDLHDYEAAIRALTAAIQLHPDRADLRLHLGEVHQQVGDLESACAAFLQIAEIEDAALPALRTAAQHLKALGAVHDAAHCMRSAVKHCQQASGHPDLDTNQHGVTEAGDDCQSLLEELLDAYHQMQMPAEALDVLDAFFAYQSEPPEMLGRRSLLLHQLGQDENALSVLQGALIEHPDSAALYQAAAQLHYALGDLRQALEYARKAVALADGPRILPVLTLAADLADASLQPEIARQILAQPADDLVAQSSFLPFFCLRAELALHNGEEIDAAAALTAALKIDAENPRVLALQARLTARRGDGDAAQQILQSAYAAWGEQNSSLAVSPAGALGLAAAALELHQWSAALYILQEAADRFSQEPRVHLRLVHGLVLRAEYQRFCDDLRIVRHAPGESTVGEFAYHRFKQNILLAAQFAESILLEGGTPADLTYWRLRGQAVFQPNKENARALNEFPQPPNGRAALLAALRHNAASALDAIAATSYRLLPREHDIYLIVQIALALSGKQPSKAIDAARKALSLGFRLHHPALPALYAVQAFIAERNGDPALIVRSLQNALDRWPDEPEWHLWLAEAMERLPEPDREAIITHLKRAVSLLPTNGDYFYRLGQAYLEAGDLQAALPALERAARLLPDRGAPYLALARVYRLSGEYAQTFQSAENAAQLEPENADIHLFLAETALEIGNPQRALQYCQTALMLRPQFPEAHLLRSRALERIGNLDEALSSFEQALEGLPPSVSLLLEHAALLRKACGDQAAIDVLTALTEQYPDDVRILMALADILAQSGESALAVKFAQKALHLKTGQLDCDQEAHLLQILGRAMRLSGQLDQAIEYHSRAIQCAPDSADVYIDLGRVYQERRQYAEALDVFQQAIALAPDDYRSYYHAGLTFKSIKDYAAAAEMLQRAARLAPDNIAIRRQLGGLVVLDLVHSSVLDNIEN